MTDQDAEPEKVLQSIRSMCKSTGKKHIVEPNNAPVGKNGLKCLIAGSESPEQSCNNADKTIADRSQTFVVLGVLGTFQGVAQFDKFLRCCEGVW